MDHTIEYRSTMSSSSSHAFQVHVSNDTFKFNAAHFVAFSGYRERLHGHNYRVSVRLFGSRLLGPDGYLLDFGWIKKVTRQVCQQLNEHFICPIYSDVIKIITTTEGEGQPTATVRLECEDGAVFSFPRSDCVMLPIVHSTTEELAIYLWSQLLEGLQAEYMRLRGIEVMEITVAEALNQEATFRKEIPATSSSDPNAVAVLDVRNFIRDGEVVAMPCLKNSDMTKNGCSCSQNRSQGLQRLADAINQGNLLRPLTVQDLESIINTDTS